MSPEELIQERRFYLKLIGREKEELRNIAISAANGNLSCLRFCDTHFDNIACYKRHLIRLERQDSVVLCNYQNYLNTKDFDIFEDFRRQEKDNIKKQSRIKRSAHPER